MKNQHASYDTVEKIECEAGREPVPEPDYYTPSELSAILRIPRRTLEKWVLNRRLPVVKVGRLNRFPRVEIQKRLLNGSLLNEASIRA